MSGASPKFVVRPPGQRPSGLVRIASRTGSGGFAAGRRRRARRGVGFPKNGTAKASKKGTFSVTMRIPTIAPGKSAGTERLTGTFGKRGIEKGKLTSKLSGAVLSECDTTVSYRTLA
jgi:hypothetical protein